jgi:hypothetical protein
VKKTASCFLDMSSGACASGVPHNEVMHTADQGAECWKIVKDVSSGELVAEVSALPRFHV